MAASRDLLAEELYRCFKSDDVAKAARLVVPSASDLKEMGAHGVGSGIPKDASDKEYEAKAAEIASKFKLSFDWIHTQFDWSHAKYEGPKDDAPSMFQGLRDGELPESQVAFRLMSKGQLFLIEMDKMVLVNGRWVTHDGRFRKPGKL